MNGQQANTGGPVDLRDIQNVVVIPKDQLEAQLLARSGHPNVTVSVNPPVFSVVFQFPHGSTSERFIFGDEATAKKTAEALVHAVELCTPEGN
jgi:hypothetical protein